MSYTGISIKEAVKSINEKWFLPAIQRPYVWGNRHESEKYICKLFDSLFHKYPIGGLILWHNNITVAHREFLTDFSQELVYKNVDSGLYGREKSLIYDGQQRLQTLFSCLKYSFNGRLLVFDLSYDTNNDEDNCTGFRFVDKNESLKPYEIKMNTLFSLNGEDMSQKIYIRTKYQSINKENYNENGLVETNLEILWDVFVKKESKCLAFFEIDSEKEDKVNEIFERLNTGGVPLSKADLLFSRIKAKYPDYEAGIMTFSKELAIRRKMAFSSYEILQVLNLIVTGRSRIDENVSPAQIDEFYGAWDKLKIPLNAFFDDYLYNHFKITHIAIIRNKMPMLVLIVFLYYYYESGRKWRNLQDTQIKLLDKFFITAELNDWTLQSYTDRFCRIVKENEDKESFPYISIEDFVRYKGNRNIEIKENIFRSYLWFSLKILLPSREFDFDYSMPNRFNPELDHIFPSNLIDRDETYKNEVNIIWNMQPVKGEVNSHKTNIHPYDYFTDKHKTANGDTLAGSKNFSLYDFLPSTNDKELWKDHIKFMNWRREKMMSFLQDKYELVLIQ